MVIPSFHVSTSPNRELVKICLIDALATDKFESPTLDDHPQFANDAIAVNTQVHSRCRRKGAVMPTQYINKKTSYLYKDLTSDKRWLVLIYGDEVKTDGNIANGRIVGRGVSRASRVSVCSG